MERDAPGLKVVSYGLITLPPVGFVVVIRVDGGWVEFPKNFDRVAVQNEQR